MLRRGAVLLGFFGCGLLRPALAAGKTETSSSPSEGPLSSVAPPAPTPASDEDIKLVVPARVEDGAMVPVSVESRLPQTREILILVDQNPVPVAASFRIPEGTEPFVYTRIKVAESGPIRCLVRAGGQLYSASTETLITLGGCS
ncbi:MAG: thiosulfate oxidation carrier protein SoxY [Bdellovibrio bacteriovorus]